MPYASTTTLAAIRAASPCEDGWRKLLGSLGKTTADDEPLDDAARLADQAIWWGQQVQNARAALRSPDLYSDDELRDFCATLQSRWGDATDYCQADAMIFALNKREFIARNCPRPETSRDVLMGMRDRWGEILLCAGIGGVVLLKLTGWV